VKLEEETVERQVEEKEDTLAVSMAARWVSKKERGLVDVMELKPVNWLVSCLVAVMDDLMVGCGAVQWDCLEVDSMVAGMVYQMAEKMASWKVIE